MEFSIFLFYYLYFFNCTVLGQKNCKTTFLVPIQSRLFLFVNLFPHISDSTITSGTSPKDNERRSGFGVQKWDDGSVYEGEFLNGLKHGKGKYTWKTGEVRAESFPPVVLGNVTFQAINAYNNKFQGPKFFSSPCIFFHFYNYHN